MKRNVRWMHVLTGAVAIVPLLGVCAWAGGDGDVAAQMAEAAGQGSGMPWWG